MQCHGAIWHRLCGDRRGVYDIVLATARFFIRLAMVFACLGLSAIRRIVRVFGALSLWRDAGGVAFYIDIRRLAHFAGFERRANSARRHASHRRFLYG